MHTLQCTNILESESFASLMKSTAISAARNGRERHTLCERRDNTNATTNISPRLPERAGNNLGKTAVLSQCVRKFALVVIRNKGVRVRKETRMRGALGVAGRCLR